MENGEMKRKETQGKRRGKAKEAMGRGGDKR